MKQAYKTLISVLLLVFSLLYAGPVPAETVTPNAILVPQVEYIWMQDGDIEDKGLVYRGNAWTEFYTGAPATAAGETDTGGFSISYHHELEGTLKITRSSVEAQVGFKIGDEMTFNVSGTTRALNQGEYVMMEYRKTWRCYKVNQKEVKHTYGWTYVNGQAIYIDEYESTGATQIAVTYQALMPQIRITYFPQ